MQNVNNAENHSQVMKYHSLGFPGLIFPADYIKDEAHEVLSVGPKYNVSGGHDAFVLFHMYLGIWRVSSTNCVIN